MTSADVVCCIYFLTLTTNSNTEANSVDPDQTVPGSTLFVEEANRQYLLRMKLKGLIGNNMNPDQTASLGTNILISRASCQQFTQYACLSSPQMMTDVTNIFPAVVVIGNFKGSF